MPVAAEAMLRISSLLAKTFQEVEGAVGGCGPASTTGSGAVTGSGAGVWRPRRTISKTLIGHQNQRPKAA
ncbi:hypothetical protein, partial [Mycobacteroides abscessus]|uniref:hypothetical protein n=1 Tax=Mycobacteroides abscessus TaxID=36809 RepID=UPI0021069E41